MTIGCAMLDPDTGGCWLGIDTQMTHSHHITYGVDKSVHARGITILISGATMIKPVLYYCLDEIFRNHPTPHPVESLLEAVREECNRRGWTGKHSEGDPETREIELLLTDGHTLFKVGPCFFAHRVPLGEFAAIGAEAYAYGAAHAARKLKAKPEDILRLAVEACIENSIYCGGEPRVWLKRKSDFWKFV